MRRHCFHDVGYGDNLGFEENAFGTQATRIIGAIQPLVVLQHDLPDRPRKGYVLQDVVAGRRVQLDDPDDVYRLAQHDP